MSKSQTKPLVTIDSDTLIFSAAAACDGRYIRVVHEPTGVEKSFRNRTEFKDAMLSKEKPITEDYKVIDMQEPEDISHPLQIIKNSTERILDNFSDYQVVFCATARNNFRDSLNYPSKYKSNRAKMLRPLLLKECQDYFIKKYKAVVADGHECDDEVGIQAYAAIKQGREAFILSPDGDSRQFDGVSLGKYDSLPEDCISIKFMHPIDYDKKGFQSYGFPWMVMQHLVGDSSDGLNPTEICKKRYGEKGCYNDLVKLTSPEEMVAFTIRKYREWYPAEFSYVDFAGNTIKSNWKHILDMYWMGTTMKRNQHELPDYWKFLESKGVSYDRKII